MRFDRYKAFPYPVLRPYSDDYLESEFQAAVDISPEENKVKIEIDYALSCPEISDLISQGKAQFFSLISCRDTYFQLTLHSGERQVEKILEDGELRGEVSVDSYVVAVTSINHFKAEDINEEFGEVSFDFREGDVLAQEETQVFFIDRDYFKPVTSVFDLVMKDGLADSRWQVDFDEEHVQIQLSPNSKQKVDSARNVRENQVILINSIYFATVMEAVQKLKDSDSRVAYENKKWAQVISSQAHNLGLDFDTHDSYLIAQRLMQEPFSLMQSYIFKGAEE